MGTQMLLGVLFYQLKQLKIDSTAGSIISAKIWYAEQREALRERLLPDGLLLPFIYTTGTAISRKRTHLPEFFHSYLPASVVFVLFRKEMILWHSADC